MLITAKFGYIRVVWHNAHVMFARSHWYTDADHC